MTLLPVNPGEYSIELPGRLERLHVGDENIRSEEVIYLQSVRGLTESEFSVRTGLSSRQSAKASAAFAKSAESTLC